MFAVRCQRYPHWLAVSRGMRRLFRGGALSLLPWAVCSVVSLSPRVWRHVRLVVSCRVLPSTASPPGCGPLVGGVRASVRLKRSLD